MLLLPAVFWQVIFGLNFHQKTKTRIDNNAISPGFFTVSKITAYAC